MSTGQSEKSWLEHILSRQGPIGDWIFLTFCIFALSSDISYFFIPVINDDRKCVKLDLDPVQIWRRSVIDSVYIIYSIFQLCTDSRSGRKFLLFFFLLDLFLILPVPQVLVGLVKEKRMTIKNFMFAFNFFIVQLVLRGIRMFPLIRKANIWSHVDGIVFAVIAFFYTYLQASTVFGALWYFLAIKKETACWKEACLNHKDRCSHSSFYCDQILGNYTLFLNDYCPTRTQNTSIYDFGIFHEALQSGIVEVSANGLQRSIYCSRWGLQNLSGFGQGLRTSTNLGENIFVISITYVGVILLVFSIGIFQMTIQDHFIRFTDIVKKTREMQWWGKLSQKLQRRITKYQLLKGKSTGVELENLLNHLSKELKRDLNRELCLDMLKQVEQFGVLRTELLEELCDKVKPVFYRARSHIYQMGDSIDEMIFVLHGKLWSYTTNDEEACPDFGDGDYCGEELLAWLLNSPTSFNLPVSKRTIQALTDVEAFAFMAEDLRYVFAKQMSPDVRPPAAEPVQSLQPGGPGTAEEP